MDDAMLIFVSFYFQFCLCITAVMAAFLHHHHRNQRHLRMVYVVSVGALLSLLALFLLTEFPNSEAVSFGVHW